MALESLTSCNKFLKKLQRKHPDLFNKERNIFEYVDVIKTDRIKVYIIDEDLPKEIIAEIATVFKVVNF